MKLLLVGGGNMGTALLAGWQSNMSGLSVSVIDPHPSDRLRSLCAADAIHSSAATVSETFDVVLLAIKPQSFADVLPQVKHLLVENGLVLSIAAGKTMQSMTDAFGADKAVIRVMPNTPALIGEGMSVLVANHNTNDTQKQSAEKLLQSVGQTLWIDNENDMHAVTALSGSGPAYVFAMIEAMQKAGVEMGLPCDMALQLARQTVLGAAMLAVKQDTTQPAELRRQVTSPGGTTEAALNVLLDAENGLDTLMQDALFAAQKRSRDLS